MNFPTCQPMSSYLYLFMHVLPLIARLFHTHFGSCDTIYWFRRGKDGKFSFVREYVVVYIYIYYIYTYVCVRVRVCGIYITCSSLRNSIDFVIFPSTTTSLVPVAPLLRPFSTPTTLSYRAGTPQNVYDVSCIYYITRRFVKYKVFKSGSHSARFEGGLGICATNVS